MLAIWMRHAGGWLKTAVTGGSRGFAVHEERREALMGSLIHMYRMCR
jgi:hypothetical protein